MPLPQVNATLNSVARGGFTEDYDRPEGTQPFVFQGGVDAYVQRKVRSGLNEAGGLQRALDVTILIDDGIPVELQGGDTLVYTLQSTSVVLAGKVQNITDPAELPGLQDYYKCYLEEIEVPVPS